MSSAKRGASLDRREPRRARALEDLDIASGFENLNDSDHLGGGFSLTKISTSGPLPECRGTYPCPLPKGCLAAGVCPAGLVIEDRGNVTAKPSLPVTTSVHFSSLSDDWPTPPEFFAGLSSSLGPFDLDPCSSTINHKAPRFYTEADDGLSKPWDGRVFVNPPFGTALPAWVEKGASEAWSNPDCRGVVFLVPARTDTKYFHQFHMRADAIYLVEGRLKFGYGPAVGRAGAPFPSCVVVYGDRPSRARFLAMDRGGRIGPYRRDCAGCGEPFRSARTDARSCSTRCRMRVSRRTK